MKSLSTITGLALALVTLTPVHAATPSDSLMAVVPGAGEVTVNGTRLRAGKVVYFYFANTGRTSFSVSTDAGAIGFSGEVDARPKAHLYVLTLDSMVRTREGKDSVRTTATGHCDLHYAERQTEVTAIDCTSDGEGGTFALAFLGNTLPAVVTALPDSPDGDATAAAMPVKPDAPAPVEPPRPHRPLPDDPQAPNP
jgi:hypothetical protein